MKTWQAKRSKLFSGHHHVMTAQQSYHALAKKLWQHVGQRLLHRRGSGCNHAPEAKCLWATWLRRQLSFCAVNMIWGKVNCGRSETPYNNKCYIKHDDACRFIFVVSNSSCTTDRCVGLHVDSTQSTSKTIVCVDGPARPSVLPWVSPTIWIQHHCVLNTGISIWHVTTLLFQARAHKSTVLLYLWVSGSCLT